MAGVSSLSEEMPWSANHQEKLRYLFDTGFLSDATLYLGPQKQKVKVHQLFLEMASLTFYRDFQQVSNNELIIEDVDPKIFIKFLRFIYLGECEAAVEECLPLLDIATKYKVQKLVDFCTEKLEGVISLQNVTTLFQQAMEFGYQSLTEATLVYFCRSAKEIIKADCFLELRQECLYEILKRDDLRVRNELDLFNAVLKWGQAECQRQHLNPEVPENLGNVLAKVLGLIRFPNMNAEEFSLKVATRKLLSNDELISMILFFNVSIEKRNEIPQGRFNATPRHYSKIGDTAKRYTVSRGHKASRLSCAHITCESLQLEVNKHIFLVGLKLFVWAEWRDDVRNDFSNFSCSISIENVQSGTLLCEKEIEEFSFFKTIDFESVELQPDTLYQITLNCSGIYKICYSNGKIYERNFLVGTKGLQRSCDLEYKDEEETEKVHFEFSRKEDSSKLPNDREIITQLIFKVLE